MKKILLCSMAAVFMWAVLLPAQDQQSGEFEKGKALFRGNCQVCHIDRRAGDQPSAYYFQFHPADFTEPDFWKKHDDKDIAKVIRKGKGAMPPQHLKQDEIDAVIYYMVHAFKTGG